MMTIDDWEQAREFWYGGKLCACLHVPNIYKCGYVNMCCTDRKFNVETISGDGNAIQFIQSVQQHTVAGPLIRP